MGSVHQRQPAPEHAAEHIGESGFFEVGTSPAAPSEPHMLGDSVPPDSVPPVLELPRRRSVPDPMLQAFSEVRGLNTELQRANDALHGVNETLRSKLDQLRLTTLELEQMLDGLEFGILLVDEELTVRHFNDMAAHFLALQEYDLGGSVSAAGRSSGPRLAEWCREVLRTGKRMRRSFHSAIGEPLSLHLRRARVEGELRLILVFAEEP
jgi:nitrogen fixation/metabolism regulation signal transduction histidine kinase